METITVDAREIVVREVAQPAGWSCRLLVADDGAAFLAYLVSVGPYSIDVERIHVLRPEEHAAFRAGTLDLGALARTLAEA